MNGKWVIGRYKGARAKSVKEHADAGIGYYIKEESGAGGNYDVLAAFLIASDKPVPEHLREATIYEQEKLDNLRKSRQGNTRPRR